MRCTAALKSQSIQLTAAVGALHNRASITIPHPARASKGEGPPCSFENAFCAGLQKLGLLQTIEKTNPITH